MRIQYVVLFMMIQTMICQQPCSNFLRNESGCIQNLIYSCSWNDFMSSCQPSTSSSIGCNISLNRQACVSQQTYPTGSWAYCQFSDNCRDISNTPFVACDSSLTMAACLVVTSQTCIWQSNTCSLASSTVIQSMTSSMTYTTDLQGASVNICAITTNLAVVHSVSVQGILAKLVQTYQATQPKVAAEYKAMQSIPGCLAPTTMLYSQMSCTFAGLNALACLNITTAGENCRYVNGQCRTLTDFQTAQCSWQLNINACLSITNINQQCYWKSICQQGKVTSCAAYTSPVSPSWCQAYTNADSECFYDQAKQICSPKCRGASLINTAKTCRQSLYGCQFVGGFCLFKDVTSQCGLAGQNRASCMKASENCQFVNGLCNPLSSASLSSVLCTAGLNEQACSAVTNNTQTCQFDTGECKTFKVTSDQVCVLDKVNQNVCQRITYEACYYIDKQCVKAANQKCTDPGLNLLGCLTTKNTASPCQWSSTMGQCVNISIKPNVTDCDLTLVNDFACRSISFDKGTSASPNYVYCTYNSIYNSCQPLLQAALTNCVSLTLNQAACQAVSSGACRWLQGSCQPITSLTATVTCSQLSNVTMPTCALVFANNEPCYYTAAGNRCTSSVIFNNDCEQAGLNSFGCSAMTKNPCYFNNDTNTCSTASSTDGVLLAKLICSQANLKACLLITTQFQYCMYNTQRSQCQLQTFPTLATCAQFTNTNRNTCLAYYTDTNSQIDATNYCTYDSVNNKCKQYTAGGTAPCYTDFDINLHVCAKLTTAACYFDFSTLTCTINPSADMLNTILCAQGNVVTCAQITTPGQICQWSADNVACQNVDPPFTCDTAAVKININYCGSFKSTTVGCSWDPTAKACSITSKISNACQGLNAYFCALQTVAACYYNTMTQNCSLVTSLVSTTLTCTTYSTNKEGCMALNGPYNTCKWVSVGTSFQCQLYTAVQLDDSSFYWTNPTCSDIAAVTTFIVNYSVCAMNSDSKCAYDSTANKCKILENTAVCQNGNSLNNCGSSCVWNGADLSCSGSSCPTTSVLSECMAASSYCSFTAGACSSASQLTNCALYGDGTTTTKYTNIMCYQQDPVGTCFPTPNYGCTTTATSNCLDIKGPGNQVLCSQVLANCVWNSLKNVCTVSTKVASKCEDYTSKYGCLMDIVFICLWDNSTRKCTTTTLVREDNQDARDDKIINVWWKTCDKLAIMGKAACLSIESCIFFDKGYQCQVPTNTPVICSDALGVDQCYKLQTTQLCIWKNLTCTPLTVLQAANESCFDLFNSAPSLCVAAKKQGQLCIYIDRSDQGLLGWCDTVDANVKLCTDQLSLYACMAIMTTGQLCVYANKCQIATPATQLCTDNINIYTCLAITTDNQSCIWMGQLCAPFTGDNFTMTTYSSISQNSCRKAYTKLGVPVTPTQGVKYSSSAAACVASDPTIDTCQTGGLNYYGCIQTAADLCTWDRVNMKCIVFVDTNLTSCTSYVNVSARVCELVKDLACYYLSGNCANAPNTLICTQNLSKTACLQQLKSCMWVNNKCQVQDVIPGITQCTQTSNNTYFLQLLSSLGSCASVVGQACFYNGSQCTNQFDGNVRTCSTLGLNLDGCTQIKTMQCQFVNGQCQSFVSQGLGCRQTLNVNALVCATIQEQCKFSSVKRACTGSYQYDSCLSPGLSVKGCQISKSCIWNPDYQQCTCTSSPTTFCATYSQSLCNAPCIWRINYCALKKCEDLSQAECKNNMTLNGYTCYLDANSICRSAQTCVQVKNVGSCNDITIGTTQCGSYSNGYCQNMICELITNQSLCSGICQWNGNYCTTLYCSSFNTAANCKGTYVGQSCVFINNLCTGITQCQVLTQTQCSSVTIKQSQCRWQQNNPYSQTYECSANPCRPIGQSMSNCHGAEVYGQVCVLQSDFSCAACESITDQCNCNQFPGYCLYANNQCSSTLCSYLTKDTCALWPQKCQWSATTSTCIMQCQKFSKTDCQTQQTTSKLCYWDSILSTCQTGVQPQIVIDTVAPLLITLPKYAFRIIMIIYMLI